MLYALWLSYHSNTEAVLFACLLSGWATKRVDCLSIAYTNDFNKKQTNKNYETPTDSFIIRMSFTINCDGFDIIWKYDPVLN